MPAIRTWNGWPAYCRRHILPADGAAGRRFGHTADILRWDGNDTVGRFLPRVLSSTAPAAELLDLPSLFAVSGYVIIRSEVSTLGLDRFINRKKEVYMGIKKKKIQIRTKPGGTSVKVMLNVRKDTTSDRYTLVIQILRARRRGVVFTPFTIMLEELEAYPSMEGAVPTTREGLPVA